MEKALKGEETVLDDRGEVETVIVVCELKSVIGVNDELDGCELYADEVGTVLEDCLLISAEGVEYKELDGYIELDGLEELDELERLSGFWEIDGLDELIG